MAGNMLEVCLSVQCVWCVFQMHAVCAMRRMSRAYRRSLSALSRTTYGLSIPGSRRASASCYCDCRRCGPCRRTSSNRCSSSDWSARRRSRHSSETCCLAAALSAGHTCTPFNDVTASTCRLQGWRRRPHSDHRVTRSSHFPPRCTVHRRLHNNGESVWVLYALSLSIGCSQWPVCRKPAFTESQITASFPQDRPRVPQYVSSLHCDSVSSFTRVWLVQTSRWLSRHHLFFIASLLQ